MPTYSFRRRYELAEIHPHDASPLHVVSNGPQVKLSWRRPSVAEQGVTSGVRSLLEVEIERDIGGGKPAAMLSALAERRWPAEEDVPDDSSSWLDGDRRITGRIAPFRSLPAYAQQLLQEKATEINAITGRVIAALTWRSGALTKRNPILTSGVVEVRGQAASWAEVPDGLAILDVAGLSTPVTLSDEMIELSRRAMSSGHKERTGHELLREARHLVPVSERSALVLAVGAAEIGFKEAVADLVPDATWLVEEIQSPPLEKMVEHYLPLLPKRQPLPQHTQISSRLINDLKTGVLLRNRVVHRGDPSPSRERLLKTITAAEDLLWLLDFLRGEVWALEYVSSETRAELGLAPSGRPSPGVYIYVTAGAAQSSPLPGALPNQ